MVQVELTPFLVKGPTYRLCAVSDCTLEKTLTEFVHPVRHTNRIVGDLQTDKSSRSIGIILRTSVCTSVQIIILTRDSGFYMNRL